MRRIRTTWSAVALPSRSLCERCSHRGGPRFETPWGVVCATCCERGRAEVEEAVEALAHAYGVWPDPLTECLSADGHICLPDDPAEGVSSFVPYLASWEEAARAAAPDRATLNRACRSAGRAVWGLALHLGVPLQGVRAVPYHPAEVPRPLVEWACEARSHYMWLIGYAIALEGLWGGAHGSLSAPLAALRAFARQRPESLPAARREARYAPYPPTHRR